MEIKKILYPIDFSETSTQLLKQAIDIAKTFGAELVLIHVVHFNIQPSFFEIVKESKEEIIKKMYKKYDNILEKLEISYQMNFSYFLAEGDPFKEIQKIVNSYNIDLLVIPSHGHSSLIHNVLGSLSDKLIRHLNKPILLLKPDSFDI